MHLLKFRRRAARPRRPDRVRLQPSLGPLEARQLLAPVAALVAPARGAVQRLANLPYTSLDGRRLALDVYLPPGPIDAPRPTIVAIHGGGWRRFSKEDFGPRAAVFAQRGYVVVAPNYTLARPGIAAWPANFEDVRAAVAWTRANAGRFGIDPDRIVAMGESAGGHLAELLGSLRDHPDGLGERAHVRAVVSLAGPSDLIALDRDSRQGAGLAVTQLLGGPASRLTNLARLASPLTHVSTASAPMLLVHGRGDALVPPSQSASMLAALQRAGVPARLLMVNAGHALSFRAGGRDLVPEVLAFLDESFRLPRFRPLASAVPASR